MKPNIADLRKDYQSRTLDITDVFASPFEQFHQWFAEALNAEIPEPNAMTLATATRSGFPSARVVLLKGLDEHGFVFYTNYESRKGRQLANNPKAALVFSWLELERQIRIEGTVERVSEEESTAYFNSRPKGSRIGAWASPQSDPIESRSILEERYQNLAQQYAEIEAVPRPEHWGGYRVIPTWFEFWQGRPSRLHDRIAYIWKGETWQLERLAP